MVRNAILKMKFEIPNHTVQPIDKQTVQTPNIMKKSTKEDNQQHEIAKTNKVLARSLIKSLITNH